jgi:hypothetical protein
MGEVRSKSKSRKSKSKSRKSQSDYKKRNRGNSARRNDHDSDSDISFDDVERSSRYKIRDDSSKGGDRPRSARSRSVKKKKKRSSFDDDEDDDRLARRKRDSLRSRSKSNSRLRKGRNNSDSDESSGDHRSSRGKRTQGGSASASRSRRPRDHSNKSGRTSTSVKRSESRKSIVDSDSDSSQSDHRGKSSKSNLSRRDTSHISHNSDKESDSDSDSDSDLEEGHNALSDGRYSSYNPASSISNKSSLSKSVHNSEVSIANSTRRMALQRAGSNPNMLQRSVSSRPQLGRQNSSTLNGSFNNLEQMPIPARSRLMKSNSFQMTRQDLSENSLSGMNSRPQLGRNNTNQNSTFNGSSSNLNGSSNNLEQIPIPARPRLMKSNSFQMTRQDLSDKSISGTSFHNNNQRQTVSRAGLMRNASARNLTPVNRISSLGNSLHLPPNNDNVQRPTLARNLSNRSMMSTNQMPGQQPLNRSTSGNESLGNSLHLPPNNDNVQRPAMARAMSNRSIISTNQMPGQQPLNRSTSQRYPSNANANAGNGNNNALLSTSTHSAMRLGSQQALPTETNSQLYRRSHSEDLLRNGNAETMTNNVAQQSQNGMVNSQWADHNKGPPSVVGGSMSVMSDGSSIITSHTRKSHQTLADQIHSRSLIEEMQSVVSCRSLDPPGADSQHLTEYLSDQYSDDDSSYDTFEDDEESYVELCDEDEEEFSARNDHPNAVTSSKSELYEETEDSEESEESNAGDDSSYTSMYNSSDDDDDDDNDNKYNYKMRLATNMHLDAGSSPSGTSSGLVQEQNNEEDSRKSTSRFSSDISFEYDQEIGPPKRISSFKAEKLSSAEPVHSKEKDNDNVVIDQEESSLGSPRNWLAQQISRQKITDLNASSNSLEPKATNIELRSPSLEPEDTKIDPQNDSSSSTSESVCDPSTSEFDSDLEDFAAKESMEQNGNSRSYSANTRKHSSIDIDAPEALNTKSGVLRADERVTTSTDQLSQIAISSPSKDDMTMKSSITKIENKQERRKNEPGKKKYKNRDLIEGDNKRGKNIITKHSKKNKECADVSSPEELLTGRDPEKRNNAGNDALDTKIASKENGSKMTKNRDVELCAGNGLLKEKDIKKKKRKKKKETDDDELSKKLSPKMKNDTKVKKKSNDMQHDKATKKDRVSSSKIHGTRRPKQVKKSQRKSEKTAGSEDKSVMSLIDKLKAYELGQQR